ncbi:MAG: glycine cleavage system aminomethyltransferase GcvT [Vicinamibacterales bacterium]
MAETPVLTVKKTPLHARHLAHGARMVAFAGWDMPIEYGGITQEHLAVRQQAGLFDVSHMGEIEIAGSEALAAVQHVSCNDAAKLAVGQIQYSGLLTPEGTFVDDVLVYRFATDHFLLVVNASNTDKDFVWIRDRVKRQGWDAAIVNTSSRYALLALQGPRSRAILQRLTTVDLANVKYYWFVHGEVAGVRGTISRTGYTGENGYEIFVPPASADRLWLALLEAGREDGLVPAGLGARDTLRLEAAMRLYGNDIDETTTALEADLSWIVGWEKTDLPGRDALCRQRETGVSKRLVGLELSAPGIARHGHHVMVAGRQAGVVTSGTQTPFLRKSIALAYVEAASIESGGVIEIDVRGRRVPAQVVPLPFYRRPRSV